MSSRNDPKQRVKNLLRRATPRALVDKFINLHFQRALELVNATQLSTHRDPTFLDSRGLNYFPDFGDVYWEYERAIEADCGYIVGDGIRVLQLLLLCRLVHDLPQGDYAELGTYRGRSARILWRKRHPEARLYCFDSFEGFAESDAAIEKERLGKQLSEGAFVETSEILAADYITGGEPRDLLVMRKGHFPETFAGLEENRWRLVHLDADLYAPMRAGLEAFWPRLVPGGVVVIHDYNNAWPGAKAAADEFFGPLRITPVPLCDMGCSAVVIKDKQAQPEPAS